MILKNYTISADWTFVRKKFKIYWKLHFKFDLHPVLSCRCKHECWKRPNTTALGVYGHYYQKQKYNVIMTHPGCTHAKWDPNTIGIETDMKKVIFIAWLNYWRIIIIQCLVIWLCYYIYLRLEKYIEYRLLKNPNEYLHLKITVMHDIKHLSLESLNYIIAHCIQWQTCLQQIKSARRH